MWRIASLFQRPSRRRGQRRRGSLYISVMGTAFIVGTVALLGVHQARLNLKAAQTATDRVKAQTLAQSAVELALSTVNADPNWQTTYAYDTEYPSPALAVNGGTLNWKLVNAGNGIRRLDGIGRVGKATYVYSVDLGGCDYLACGLSCGRDITVQASEAIKITGAPLATRQSLIVQGTVTADVEATAILKTGILTGTQTVPAPLRPLPDPTTVFDYYLAQGTRIASTSLDRVVLSPRQNPFGSTNAQGIYIIDAAGGSVRIRRSRIVGTLVIVNAGSGGVELTDQVNWEPAFPNYPAMLIQGSLSIKIDNSKLSESDEGTNFNPSSTPWQGASDSANDDSYPSALAGILYCTGDLTFAGQGTNLQSLQGVVVCHGACSVVDQANVTIKYDAAFHDSPPPGFLPGDSRVLLPRSWRQTKAN